MRKREYMFDWLFGHRRCNCADNLIKYLEERDYEYVPRKFNKETLELVKKHLSKANKDIDSNPILTDMQKALVRQEVLRNAFYKKVKTKK